MLAQTVSRLVSTSRPRMVTTYRRLNALQNSVEMVSAKQQRKENKLNAHCFKVRGS